MLNQVKLSTSPFGKLHAEVKHKGNPVLPHWMTRTMWLKLQADLIEQLDDKFDVDWVSEDTANLCKIEIKLNTAKKPKLTIYEAIGEPWLMVNLRGKLVASEQFETGNHRVAAAINKLLSKKRL